MDAHSGVSHAFSVNQVAEALNISRRTVYNMLTSGRLRAVRIGARQRIPAAELDRLCRLQGHDPATAPGDAVASVSAATLVELAASPADADVITPPQPPPPAVRADPPAAPSPASPVERPRLSDLLARTRDATTL